MENLIYNGISVNLDWAFTQTKAQFMEHEKHHGLTKDQMNELWSLILAKKGTS